MPFTAITMGELRDKVKAGGLDAMPADEPVFLLRGQDDVAADTVDYWAVHAGLLDAPVDKVRGAKDVAQQMRDWPTHKIPD